MCVKERETKLLLGMQDAAAAASGRPAARLAAAAAHGSDRELALIVGVITIIEILE